MEKFAQANAEQVLNNLGKQYASLSKYITDLSSTNIDAKYTAEKELKKVVPLFNVMFNQVKTILTTPAPKVGQLYDELIKFADDLDKMDCFGFADKIDGIIKTADEHNIIDELIKFADELDSNGYYYLANIIDTSFVKQATFIPKQMGRSKQQETSPAPIQSPREGTLSTRYCPDHVGAQAIRISDGVFQCPYDGKIYNYSTGYTNYKGQQILGGGVAEQTPNTSDYGGIPMRIYDSRQNIINRIY